MEFKICITIELIVNSGYVKYFKMQDYNGELLYKTGFGLCIGRISIYI